MQIFIYLLHGNSFLVKYYLLNINQLPTLYSILSKIASLFFVSAILTIFSHKFH